MTVIDEFNRGIDGEVIPPPEIRFATRFPERIDSETMLELELLETDIAFSIFSARLAAEMGTGICPDSHIKEQITAQIQEDRITDQSEWALLHHAHCGFDIETRKWRVYFSKSFQQGVSSSYSMDGAYILPMHHEFDCFKEAVRFMAELEISATRDIQDFNEKYKQAVDIIFVVNEIFWQEVVRDYDVTLAPSAGPALSLYKN